VEPKTKARAKTVARFNSALLLLAAPILALIALGQPDWPLWQGGLAAIFILALWGVSGAMAMHWGFKP
jgi:hypothetical protein